MPSLGYTLPKLQADIITISHPHPGHNYTEGIGGKPRCLSRPGEYDLSGVFITGISTFHDNEQGHKLGKNTAFIIDIDGIVVAHLGDLGHPLTANQAVALSHAAVLLLPVGGVNTIDPTCALQTVRQLSPKVVIPMHYQTPSLAIKLEPPDRFLKEIGLQDITPQPRLNLTRANLPTSTQVIVLDYRH